MSNPRIKLYRSVATTALILATGIVLAPTIVTAGFHPSTKKAEAPSEQPAVEVAAEPTAKQTSHKPHALRQTPAVGAPSTATSKDTAPQAEEIPAGPTQRDSDGETTFAVADFAPAGPSSHEFNQSGSGVGIAVASNDAGTGIARFSRQPAQSGASGGATGSGNASQASADPTQNAADKGTQNVAAADTTPAPANGSNPKSGDDKTPPVADQQTPPTVIAKNDDRGSDKTGGQPADNRPTTTVPEPTSIGLLAAGVLGLLIARRRA